RRARPEREAIRDPEVNYYLTAESALSAATVPYPPTAGGPTTVRITHDNSCGPVRAVGRTQSRSFLGSSGRG
ncbi:MAG: hypothetical protein J2P46_06010, partial [Zavarzinella sp.]|nr:hypothetical protein [Zavarzinella sp.]